MADTLFDLGRLFESVAAQRERLRLSWAALSRQVGVATSTIRRFGESDDAEADGVLALLRWLDAVPEDFIDGGRVAGERLASCGEGVVRVDMELIAAAEGDKRGARGRTRTTIQRLATVAEHAGQSVASLTRLSDL